MLTFYTSLDGMCSAPMIGSPLSGHRSTFAQVMIVRFSTSGSDLTARQRRSTLFQKLGRQTPDDMLALLDKLDLTKSKTSNPPKR